MAQTASQTRQQISAQAHKLEQRVMTGRWLSHIFPGFDASRTPMGRYNFLSIAIAAANPRLRELLLADRAGAVGAEWKMLLKILPRGNQTANSASHSAGGSSSTVQRRCFSRARSCLLLDTDSGVRNVMNTMKKM